ncbi:Coenzyme F420 hydrogenase/dehydrogenase, beta subunit C-terminal domain [Paenarthrobacter sp. TAF1]|uniref:Coenzyme F420 hydrogenase/dehydrogenase, beta subunit C-terminal domain n=1 Tax=Paenarthrobacter sp. TAF1 TaxID=3233067 RepID=UPI003F9BFFE4
MTASQKEFDEIVKAVVRNGNCSGCGACALIDKGTVMKLDEAGFNRPRRQLPIRPSGKCAVSELKQSCPGLIVERPGLEGSEPSRQFEPTLGHAVSSWQAWAADDETRFRGSSGGVLTALAAWMIETGKASQLIGASVDRATPERSADVQLHAGDNFLQLSGSRYAPVSIASRQEALSSASVVVGKPCEAAALRKVMDVRGQEERPLLLSFFCAGVPSQLATERLLRELGIPGGASIRTLRYRGHGWPGEFFVETNEGQTFATSYDESWGKTLGPSMQWRCKICPDGVGESADIVAGDFWKTDAKGYPEFTDSSGVSALIARTRRGHEVIMSAIAAGVIVAEPLVLSQISAVQPLQVDRRATLWGRVTGRRIAGWSVPEFRGFRLRRLAMQDLVKTVRYLYGSFRRSWMEKRREQ